MSKNILVSALVALVVGVGSTFLFIKSVDQSNVGGGLSDRDVRAISLTAAGSGEFTASKNGVVQGNALSTTTQASMTLKASDIVGHSAIAFNLVTAAATVTLPASTTLNALGFLPRPGDRTSIAFINSTSTAVSLTVAGGTGTLLQIASTSAAILSGKVGILWITRKVNLDYAFTFVPVY